MHCATCDVEIMQVDESLYVHVAYGEVITDHVARPGERDPHPQPEEIPPAPKRRWWDRKPRHKLGK